MVSLTILQKRKEGGKEKMEGGKKERKLCSGGNTKNGTGQPYFGKEITSVIFGSNQPASTNQEQKCSYTVKICEGNSLMIALTSVSSREGQHIF